MPPHQTKLASDTGPDAAGLGPATALLKGTSDEVSAAPRPDAAIPMRTDTFSDKEAAAPPDASARGVLSVLKRCWHSFQGSRQRERLRACLYNMSERQLMDIGLTSGDIDYIVAYRAFKRLRDGTTLP